ncbi:MAG TPA: DUF1501 domain-containing protein [Pirellulales bacterium]|nr:DUF1501 domain-containing protein [Pirellulales bacterium]
MNAAHCQRPMPCPGPMPRREFLRLGTLALGGLGLSDVLAARAAAGQATSDASVILFWMWGGPSQLETYDLKPEAPSEFRGPFRPIASNVPGMDICELFPRQARLADRFSLVRSLHHEMASHNDGSIEVLTGKTPAKADPTSTARSEHPDLGMIASKMLGVRRGGLPPYIGIPRQPFMTQPTYLGLSHKAYEAGDPSAAGYRPQNLSIGAGLNGARLGDRRGLVEQFDRYRRDLDLNGSLEATDEFRRRAFDLLLSPDVAKAFDLDQERPELRDRYGRHLWGQSCLLARRLAEAGSAVVTIDALAPQAGTPLYFSWDDHANAQPGWDMAKGMRWRAEYMDPALSALIEDLYDRGLDKKVMVVACGEFGRTPRLNTNNGCLGRDHWPGAMTALVSGGGLRMGQVVGATNSKAEYPAERPMSPQHLLATIYRHLGIDHRRALVDFFGRPIPILSEGEPIRELI